MRGTTMVRRVVLEVKNKPRGTEFKLGSFYSFSSHLYGLCVQSVPSVSVKLKWVFKFKYLECEFSLVLFFFHSFFFY